MIKYKVIFIEHLFYYIISVTESDSPCETGRHYHLLYVSKEQLIHLEDKHQASDRTDFTKIYFIGLNCGLATEFGY